MIDKSNNTDDLVLDQKRRIPATLAISMNTLKPMLYFQVSMLRMWADSLERFAGKYEQALDETATIIAEHSGKDKRRLMRTGEASQTPAQDGEKISKPGTLLGVSG